MHHADLSWMTAGRLTWPMGSSSSSGSCSAGNTCRLTRNSRAQPCLTASLCLQAASRTDIPRTACKGTIFHQSWEMVIRTNPVVSLINSHRKETTSNLGLY